MKVQNLLHQPLELDFGTKVVRFNARETKDIDDKYADHATFNRNKKDVQVLVKPKAPKEKDIDLQPEK